VSLVVGEVVMTGTPLIWLIVEVELVEGLFGGWLVEKWRMVSDIATGSSCESVLVLSGVE
jgi:hypothetical protein